MADKKITELPYIDTLSGSLVGTNTPLQNTVIPLVLRGNTNQINIENFSKFVTAYSATTGSNTFIGNQTITGNTTIGGTLVVAGKITAQEFFTEITSASIIFESGSSLFGNSSDDTHTFTGSILTTGSIILNGSAIGTGQLNIQTASQDLVNRGISSVTGSINTQSSSQDLVNRQISSTTGSINTTTSSFDSVFLRISSTTGSINTTTSSFDSVFLGISSFTGSFNSISGSYATTGSNTFRGNQSITGSLSVSAGEFNVTTGSGNMTSSLIFDHTQNDGVTLGLRHNDRLSVADHTFNVNVWAAGVYTSFVRNGTPYSILNVEAFDDNKIYLYRDTRLYNKSLVIDNNLTVQKEVVIGSGSLSIQRGQFNAVTGSGALTSSLSFTHTEVDPITGNGTLELRYKNNQVGSENNAWKFVATDNGVQVRYDQYTTSNKMLFSVSSFGSNFDKLLIWRDARLFGTGLTVDDSLLVKGVITGSLLSTNGVVSSSNQLFELNGQTGSQDSVNLGISSVTGSLIGITNGLMAFTASLDNTYATDAQLYQLYQATASIQFATASLNTQTGSQDLVNLGISSVTGSLIGITNGLMAFTAALDSTYATDAQLLPILQATRSLELLSGSLIGITNGLMAFTASLDNTFATDAQLLPLIQATSSIQFATASLNTQTGSQNSVNFTISVVTSSIDVHILKQSIQTGSQDLVNLGISTYTGSQNVINTSVDSHILKQSTQTGSQDSVNLGISTFTGSLRSEVNLIELYTASLKGAAIVSSSQQITNYYKFAETASANTFYGNQTITGSVSMTGSLRVGDWIGGSPHVDETARFDVRTTVDRGIKITGNVSSDVIITAYRGASDDLVRGMRLQGNGIGIYIGDGNANTGSSVASFNTNGLAFAAGKGIDFSATSNGSGTTSSELLNDYEEGSWTPTIVGGSTAGTATYTARTGQYTKVGNCVHFRGDIIWTGHNGSGLMSVTGLPFTIGSNYMSSVVARFDQTTTASNYIGGAYIYITQIDMQVMPVGGGAPGNLNITAGGDLRISGYYFVS